MRYGPIAYIIWVFIKIYQLHKKKRGVNDILVKVNVAIISAFCLFYYYFMPVKGFLFWGSINPATDYGEATANAVVSILNYGAVLLVFYITQGIFFLIVRVQNNKRS